jgi:hypothetical protein
MYGFARTQNILEFVTSRLRGMTAARSPLMHLLVPGAAEAMWKTY